jgi:serine/threonine protein kinase
MVYMQINGLVLGKYRIEKLINNGSFASVFRAKEEFTNRTVAIKVLPKSIYPTGRMRYLLTELSAMGRNWGHSNIVSIHTVEPGDDEYVAYIVMEYVNGSSLRQLITTTPLHRNLAINIALDICRGLIAAHEQNIIHRDIKPQNILLTTDQIAKISDFGVARILEASTDYAGTITGTRRYMAPEQYEGNYDYRVDLYSTGLILYEMFMGKFPFRGKTQDEIQVRKQSEEIDFDYKLPEDMREILQRALHRDAQARYQTASELYNDLNYIRKKWYADAVRHTMTNQSNPAIQGAMLSEHRKDLRLSAEAAEKIESEISEEQKVKVEKQAQLQLETQVNLHYDKAVQLIGGTQSQQALQEVQQAHRLYLSSVKATKKADWIFRHLSDLMIPPQPPSTATEMIGLIDQLSVSEVSELRAWFNNRSSSNGDSTDVPPPVGSGALPTDTGTGSDLTFQPLNPQETAPEFVLRKLHEVVQAPHERIAAQVRQLAEEYAQTGKSRRSRVEYKKLGELYRESAENFIESENWESGADCYARARLAYTASRRYGRARQCAQEAGTYYAMQANSLERAQAWADAGRLYALSADNYAHANLWEAANQSLSHTTICYFNVAENARAAGDLSLSYNYCDKILTISKRMKRASNAVAGARKLLHEIEDLFTVV